MRKLLAILLAVVCIAAVVSCDDTCSHQLRTFHAGQGATCSSTGTIDYWECDNCQVKFATQTSTEQLSEEDLVSPIDPNAHVTALTSHAKVDATCTNPGTKAYYECESCHKKYSESAATNELTDLSIPVNATAHPSGALSSTASKAATCMEEGNIAYWTCSGCHNKYSDANGTTAVTDAQIKINKNTSHVGTLEKTDAEPATCVAEGNIAYWTCSACENTYSNAAGTTVVSEDDIVIHRHGSNINSTTGICSQCNNYIVDDVYDLYDAVCGGVPKIGLKNDIEWEMSYTEWDLSDIQIDLCGCEISGYKGTTYFDGSSAFGIGNGTITGVEGEDCVIVFGDSSTVIPVEEGSAVEYGADLSSADPDDGIAISVHELNVSGASVVFGIRYVDIAGSTFSAPADPLSFNGSSGTIAATTSTTADAQTPALNIVGQGEFEISDCTFTGFMNTVKLWRGCNVTIYGETTISAACEEYMSGLMIRDAAKVVVEAGSTFAINIEGGAGYGGAIEMAWAGDIDDYAFFQVKDTANLTVSTDKVFWTQDGYGRFTIRFESQADIVANGQPVEAPFDIDAHVLTNLEIPNSGGTMGVGYLSASFKILGALDTYATAEANGEYDFFDFR